MNTRQYFPPVLIAKIKFDKPDKHAKVNHNMKIKGIITKVSANYPFQVEVGKVQFISHFQFKVGQDIDLTFEGKKFDAPCPSGFINCWPNGMSEYYITGQDIKMMQGDSVARHMTRFPLWVHEVVLTGKKKVWRTVESFYNYHYSAEYDVATKVLVTNYAVA